MSRVVEEVGRRDYWMGRYRSGEAGWDLGGPCPVFVDLLDSEWAPPLPGRVAFPGCGLGHDVRHFRERGYEAVGFDFAVPSGDGLVESLDVFEIATRYPAAFDAVVEYTCYCAIPPSRRREYAGVLRDALRPGGVLIALLFPVEEREDGSPFGIDESEIDEIWAPGMELLHVETPSNSVEPRLGRERLAILKKPTARS